MNALAVLEPVARIAVATLFNSLWEATLLALAVWAILNYLPNINATTRYAGWCVALVASLLIPIATAIPQISVLHVQTHAQVQATARPAAPHAAPVKPSSAWDVRHTTATTPPAPPLRMPERPRFALPELIALAIFALWAIVALALIARLIVNLWRLESLKRDALPIPVEYRELLPRWDVAEKGGREVRLCVSERVEVPVAVGLFDSMVLIPKHLLETLSQNEIDQITLHELAHLRRADDWTNGLQRFIQAIFFFNPAILFIAQQLDLEREVACDDWVLRQTGDVRPYATCLTRMAEVTAWPHRALAAPGVFVTRRSLSIRVERLLRAGRNVRTSISFGPAGALAAALIVLFFIAESVAPSFAFTVPENAAPALHVASAATPKSAKPVVKAHAHVSAQTRTLVQAHTVVQTHTAPKTIDVPAQHVKIPEMHLHLPAQTIRVPAVNVDVQGRRIDTPPVHVTMPESYAFTASGKALRAADSAMRAISLKHAIAAGGFNCTGCDFSRQNLSGHDFRNQRMNGADFSHAELQNANFGGAELIGADFSWANLQGANFSGAHLTGCDLSHANLAGVNFNGAQLTGCDFDAHSLSPAQARALIYSCRTGCDFTGANLEGQDLRNLGVAGINLSHADLRNADLSGSTLSGVDLEGARLAGARLDGTTFTGCSFDGVDLHGVDLSHAKIIGSRLSTTPR